MELKDIIKLESFSSEETANKYLDLGWKIVNIYNTAYDTQPPGCAHQTPHYVVAWFGENPTYPPKDPEWGIVI